MSPVKWGGSEPPKATRQIPGLDTLITEIKTQPGTWGQVTLDGVKASTLHQALALAGMEVVTRKGGTEVHACFPATDVADQPGVEA